jgi:hypothetical protein
MSYFNLLSDYSFGIFGFILLVRLDKQFLERWNVNILKLLIIFDIN